MLGSSWSEEIAQREGRWRASKLRGGVCSSVPLTPGAPEVPVMGRRCGSGHAYHSDDANHELQTSSFKSSGFCFTVYNSSQERFLKLPGRGRSEVTGLPPAGTTFFHRPRLRRLYRQPHPPFHSHANSIPGSLLANESLLLPGQHPAVNHLFACR